MTLEQMKEKVSFYGAEAVKGQFQKEKDFCKTKMLEFDVSMDSVSDLPNSMLEKTQVDEAVSSMSKQKVIFAYRMKKADEHIALVDQAVKAIETDAVADAIKDKKG